MPNNIRVSIEGEDRLSPVVDSAVGNAKQKLDSLKKEQAEFSEYSTSYSRGGTQQFDNEIKRLQEEKLRKMREIERTTNPNSPERASKSAAVKRQYDNEIQAQKESKGSFDEDVKSNTSELRALNKEIQGLEKGIETSEKRAAQLEKEKERSQKKYQETEKENKKQEGMNFLFWKKKGDGDEKNSEARGEGEKRGKGERAPSDERNEKGFYSTQAARIASGLAYSVGGAGGQVVGAGINTASNAYKQVKEGDNTLGQIATYAVTSFGLVVAGLSLQLGKKLDESIGQLRGTTGMGYAQADDLGYGSRRFGNKEFNAGDFGLSQTEFQQQAMALARTSMTSDNLESRTYGQLGLEKALGLNVGQLGQFSKYQRNEAGGDDVGKNTREMLSLFKDKKVFGVDKGDMSQMLEKLQFQNALTGMQDQRFNGTVNSDTSSQILGIFGSMSKGMAGAESMNRISAIDSAIRNPVDEFAQAMMYQGMMNEGGGNMNMLDLMEQQQKGVFDKKNLRAMFGQTSRSFQNKDNAILSLSAQTNGQIPIATLRELYAKYQENPDSFNDIDLRKQIDAKGYTEENALSVGSSLTGKIQKFSAKTETELAQGGESAVTALNKYIGNNEKSIEGQTKAIENQTVVLEGIKKSIENQTSIMQQKKMAVNIKNNTVVKK